jgi:hypothetical protein
LVLVVQGLLHLVGLGQQDLVLCFFSRLLAAVVAAETLG